MSKSTSREVDKIQLLNKQANYDELQKLKSDMTIWNTPPYFLRKKEDEDRADRR